MGVEESALEQFLRGQSLPGEKNGKVGKVLAEFLDAPAALRQQVAHLQVRGQPADLSCLVVSLTLRF